MIAQWDSSLSVLPVARVQFHAGHGGVSRGNFPWLITPCQPALTPEPAWQKMDQSPLNGTTKPVEDEEEAQSSTTDRQWLKNNPTVSP